MTTDFEDATGLCPVTDQQVSHWARATLRTAAGDANCTLAIRVVDAEEGLALNHRFRGKDRPTNVLSFPADVSIPDGPRMLGDLALCYPVIEQEAQMQEKSIEAHLAHLVVHGILHLLGRDHVSESEASNMEAEEIGILRELGYANPYMSEDEYRT